MLRALLFSFLLTTSAGAQVSITTYRNDLARSGQNLNEKVLTLANVNPAQFGKLLSLPIDGQVYAQPLYLPSLTISGSIHNVVFVATEHDSVYAFDADSARGENQRPLWQVSLIGVGEATARVTDVLNCTSIQPEVGITGTPVIDPSTNTLYVVALTVGQDTHLIQRLHALDVTTGAERPGSPVVITASVPGTGSGLVSSGPTVEFDPDFYKNRAGLLLLNGVVYTAWASHCDSLTYHGWIISYSAKDLHQVAVFNTTPNAYQASFWMGGGAPAADENGNIYAVSANGQFDAEATGVDFGDSILKFSSPALAVSDYFTPFNQMDLDRNDIDLGSSTAVLLPDVAGSAAHKHLLVSAGKEGRIYLIDRDHLGHFQAGGDTQIVQSLSGAIKSLFGGPAYFNNTLYFAAAFDTLKAFPISEAHIATSPSSQSADVFGYAGGVPVITANGSSNGIVWVVEGSAGGTLHAYDASNLSNELYNSQIEASRDSLGSWLPFSVPTIANGRVYVGTSNSLVVYGLLAQPAPNLVVNAASFQPGSVAPGSLISIFGSNLASTTMSAAGGWPQRSLGGVTVLINGVAAPLLFVSPGQINAQVPFESGEGLATAMLEVADMPPVAIRFPVTPAAPAVFSNVWNQDGSLNAPDNPASVGSAVTVYITGQGALTPPVLTGEPAPGSPSKAIYPITASLGRRNATISSAGLSPGSVGLFQIQLIVPAAGSGQQPLAITVNGIASNTAYVSVSTGARVGTRQ